MSDTEEAFNTYRLNDINEVDTCLKQESPDGYKAQITVMRQCFKLQAIALV